MLYTPPERIDFVWMKEVELPMLYYGHLAEHFQKSLFSLLACRASRFLGIGGSRSWRRDNEHFFIGTDAAKVFLCVLVLVLHGVKVLQFPARILIVLGHDPILNAHVAECLIEENVSVEGKRQSEGHEADDGEANHNRELPAERFC